MYRDNSRGRVSSSCSLTLTGRMRSFATVVEGSGVGNKGLAGRFRC